MSAAWTGGVTAEQSCRRRRRVQREQDFGLPRLPATSTCAHVLVRPSTCVCMCEAMSMVVTCYVASRATGDWLGLDVAVVVVAPGLAATG